MPGSHKFAVRQTAPERKNRILPVDHDSIEHALFNLPFTNGEIAHMTNRPPAPFQIQEPLLQKLLHRHKVPFIKPIVGVSSGNLGKGTVLAILDSGISAHTALRNKVIATYTTTGRHLDMHDELGHGTHLAGIVAADDLNGTAPMMGIARETKLISICVTDDDSETAPIWRITQGLETVLKLHDTLPENSKPTAVLISFNALDNVHKPESVSHHRLAQLIQECYQRNIPVVCSAGNLFDVHRGQQGLAYPAYLPKVVAVAALENIPGKSGFGQYTETTQRIVSERSNLDIFYTVAPGAQTLSTGIASDHAYSYLSGSSQAAAVVAATILLLQTEYMLMHANTLPSVDHIASLLPKHP